MLLASTLSETYVIDRNMRVSSLKSNIMVISREILWILSKLPGSCILNDPEQSQCDLYRFYAGSGTAVLSGADGERFSDPMKLKGEIRHMARDRFGYLWISTPDESHPDRYGTLPGFYHERLFQRKVVCPLMKTTTSS